MSKKQISISLDLTEDSLFIDLSYYIFYRYYAYFQWYEKAHNIKIDEKNIKDITSDIKVQNHFKELVIKKINELKKKYKVKNNIFILKDCDRKTIWRNDEINDYKAGRIRNNFVGQFYGMGIKEVVNNGNYQILSYDCLEADDLGYLSVCEILKVKDYDKNINIITNDNDYLQLLKYSDNISIINLKSKDISERNSYDSIEIFLQMKILNGDESDNIKSIFIIDNNKIKKIHNSLTGKEVRLTKALILDIASNKNGSFDIYIKNNKSQLGLYDNYKKNQKLIDFEYIPSIYNGIIKVDII